MARLVHEQLTAVGATVTPNLELRRVGPTWGTDGFSVYLTFAHIVREPEYSVDRQMLELSSSAENPESVPQRSSSGCSTNFRTTGSALRLRSERGKAVNAHVTDVQFVYRLTGTGWSEATMTIGDASTPMSASYLDDALGDLVAAAVLLPGAESTVRVSWAEEPGEFRWVLDRSGDQVAVRILWFEALWDRTPTRRARSCSTRRARWPPSSALSRRVRGLCWTNGARPVTERSGSTTTSQRPRSSSSKGLCRSDAGHAAVFRPAGIRLTAEVGWVLNPRSRVDYPTRPEPQAQNWLSCRAESFAVR